MLGVQGHGNSEFLERLLNWYGTVLATGCALPEGCDALAATSARATAAPPEAYPVLLQGAYWGSSHVPTILYPYNATACSMSY